MTAWGVIALDAGVRHERHKAKIAQIVEFIKKGIRPAKAAKLLGADKESVRKLYVKIRNKKADER